MNEFALCVSLQFYYDDYVNECEMKGIKPLNEFEWYESLE